MSVSAPSDVCAAGVNGTTTATQTFSVATTPGAMLILTVHWGNATNTDPTLSGTVTGWTKIGTIVGGAGSFGASTGPRGVTAWYKIADGTENGGTVIATQSGTGSVMRFCIIEQLTGTLGAWATPTAAGGSDTTSGTGYSVTAASDPGSANGDTLLVATTSASGTATQSAPSVTYTGVTPVTTTLLDASFAAGGNALRAIRYYCQFTSGTSTAAPVHALTFSAATGGSTLFIRVRDKAPVALDGTTSVTATIVGAALITASASGNTSATATITGTPTVARSATGSTSVTATIVGAATAAYAASGSASLTATIVGAAAVTRNISGSLAVTATITGAGKRITKPTGTQTATATIAGSAVVTRPADGTMAVSATITGAISVFKSIDGNLTMTATLSSTLSVTGLILDVLVSGRFKHANVLGVGEGGSLINVHRVP